MERPASAAIGVAVLLLAIGAGGALLLNAGGIQDRLFPPEAATPLPAPKPQARVAPAAAVTPAWYLHAAGYDGAEQERKAARAPMLVYFQSTACDACRRFERDVLAAPEVKASLGGVVKVRVDPRAGEPEARLAQRFGVSRVPAVALVPRDGPPRLLPIAQAPHDLAAQLR